MKIPSKILEYKNMTKERYQELKDMMDIPPDVLDEGDGIRVAQFYDLVMELRIAYEAVTGEFID